MKATFEEKTFESYFNSELDRKSDIYFPPGQVLEGKVGFDSSSYSKSRWLWRKIGHPFLVSPRFKGADLKEIADEVEDLLEFEIDNLPRMKANILFQYKRPEFIKVPSGN